MVCGGIKSSNSDRPLDVIYIESRKGVHQWCVSYKADLSNFSDMVEIVVRLDLKTWASSRTIVVTIMDENGCCPDSSESFYIMDSNSKDKVFLFIRQ